MQQPMVWTMPGHHSKQMSAHPQQSPSPAGPAVAPRTWVFTEPMVVMPVDSMVSATVTWGTGGSPHRIAPRQPGFSPLGELPPVHSEDEALRLAQELCAMHPDAPQLAAQRLRTPGQAQAQARAVLEDLRSGQARLDLHVSRQGVHCMPPAAPPAPPPAEVPRQAARSNSGDGVADQLAALQQEVAHLRSQLQARPQDSAVAHPPDEELSRARSDMRAAAAAVSRLNRRNLQLESELASVQEQLALALRQDRSADPHFGTFLQNTSMPAMGELDTDDLGYDQDPPYAQGEQASLSPELMQALLQAARQQHQQQQQQHQQQQQGDRARAAPAASRHPPPMSVQQLLQAQPQRAQLQDLLAASLRQQPQYGAQPPVLTPAAPHDGLRQPSGAALTPAVPDAAAHPAQPRGSVDAGQPLPLGDISTIPVADPYPVPEGAPEGVEASCVRAPSAQQLARQDSRSSAPRGLPPPSAAEQAAAMADQVAAALQPRASLLEQRAADSALPASRTASAVGMQARKASAVPTEAMASIGSRRGSKASLGAPVQTADDGAAAARLGKVNTAVSVDNEEVDLGELLASRKASMLSAGRRASTAAAPELQQPGAAAPAAPPAAELPPGGDADADPAPPPAQTQELLPQEPAAAAVQPAGGQPPAAEPAAAGIPAGQDAPAQPADDPTAGGPDQDKSGAPDAAGAPAKAEAGSPASKVNTATANDNDEVNLDSF